MVRIAVLAEHLSLATMAAQTLRGDNRLHVTAVVGGGAELELPGVREAIAAAQALVYVAAGGTELLPWPEMQPGAERALVILDVAGHIGPERALRLGARGYLGRDEPYAGWASRLVEVADGKL